MSTPDFTNGSDVDLDVTTLSFERAIALRTAVDERIEAIKSEFIAKAKMLNLTVTNGNGRRPYTRRPRATHQSE